MKLTDVIKVWEELHVLDTGEVGYCDLDRAIERVVGIEIDVPTCGKSFMEDGQVNKETNPTG